MYNLNLLREDFEMVLMWMIVQLFWVALHTAAEIDIVSIVYLL